MKNNYITMAVLKAKSGKREKLREELLKLITPTRKEEGCLEYILFEDKNQTGTFYMREAFKDYKAFEAHGNTAHFKNFASQINELMLEPIQLIELEQVSN
ncbi:putative quinol monooxygenase [Flavobacterium sp.]|uniref:putative quinol monooxygenase n=1 Tax=Flavobacterium sp. TaxID=239 RepID=UPI003D0A1796